MTGCMFTFSCLVFIFLPQYDDRTVFILLSNIFDILIDTDGY